jgi:hypothetical protein
MLIAPASSPNKSQCAAGKRRGIVAIKASGKAAVRAGEAIGRHWLSVALLLRCAVQLFPRTHGTARVLTPWLRA